ncbi:MAG: hypothetical protein WCK09_07630 [Bacteroidota bacterium]
MENEITFDWIDRYNEGELDEKEKAIFQKRMNENPLLRSEVYLDACLNRFLKDTELQDLMKKIKATSRRNSGGSRLMDYILLVASMLCLAIIFGIFYLLWTNTETTPRYFLKDPTRKNHQKTAESDKMYRAIPNQNTTKDDLMGKNFKSLAEFELLIGSGAGSDQFKLISPDANDIVLPGSEVRFAWQGYDDMTGISMVIMNNQGITISRIPLYHTSAYLLKTKGFKPGLYYWKIMQENRMVMMGKFTLKPPSPLPPKRP